MITETDIAIRQWITAWFRGLNPGRTDEINTGARRADVKGGRRSKLPPVGPHVSGRSANRALAALRPVKAAIDLAIRELSILEENGDPD